MCDASFNTVCCEFCDKSGFSANGLVSGLTNSGSFSLRDVMEHDEQIFSTEKLTVSYYLHVEEYNI